MEVLTLRERKKAATRQALHEAVLRLAMAHGLENVTVDAVADEANVSRRTFSNYFSNKEEALLYGDRQRIERMLTRLRARPPQESAWQALTNAAAETYGGLTDVDPVWLAQLRMIRSHPSVLAQHIAVLAAFERDLATAIADRCSGEPDPLRTRVMAAAFLATVRAATAVWTEDPELAPLGETIMRALRHTAEHFV